MALDPIERSDRLEERVLGKIRHAILHGVLKPGERIDQEELAKSLEVSRMPVRSALVRLEEQRFVVVSPRGGTTVAPVSREDAEELYLIRTEIESLAARLAALNMTKDRISELETILGRARKAIEEGDEEVLSQQNRQFHRVGYQAAGSDRLYKLTEDFRDHSERYRRVHATLMKRSTHAHEEHNELLDAWRAGDPDAAADAARSNLENSRAAVMAALRQSGLTTT